MATDQPALVLFDGVCSFCNASVLFVIDRDPSERFVFAPLDSDVGQRTLSQHSLTVGPSTMVLVEDDTVYTRSTAALRIARRMRFPWPLLYAFILVPRVLRDALYSAFAARRYWFGRTESCRVPTPELKRRFVD